MEKIVLVNEQDKQLGIGEKMDVHRKGTLHRAFSLFVFNSKKETLIQKRASGKYHWGGSWSNACCSHPRPNEEIIDAVHRKVQQELGFDCEVKKVFDFMYKAEFENGLFEHEFDHVFIGQFDGVPRLNPEEASEYQWISLHDLRKDLKEHPQKYTPWLKIALEKFEERNIQI